MISFESKLRVFGEKGEKTGWTYILIPSEIADKINPKVKTIYRVKGKVDNFLVKQLAILPMGDGDFFIPYNANFKKAIKKYEGAVVEVTLDLDTSEIEISEDLLICLEDVPIALDFFKSIKKSYQNFLSKWVDSAKTIETKSKRIAKIVRGCEMRLGMGEMMAFFKEKD